MNYFRTFIVLGRALAMGIPILLIDWLRGFPTPRKPTIKDDIMHRLYARP